MLLVDLCNSIAPSGYEECARNIIREKVKDLVDEINIDKMGNLIAHKKGSGPKVALYSHMDEIGFIITGYNDDGTLRFSTLGNIDSNAVASKVVCVGQKKIPGVIGLKPIHLQDKKERMEKIKFSNCCIDIGSASKEETREVVKLGDYAVFNTEFKEFGDNLIKGKGFDDRIGCSVLINILKEEYECDLYCIFNVQEKVGQRGAFVSTFNVKPDLCIVVDAYESNDIPGTPKYLEISDIGGGPVISVKSGSLLFNNNITNSIISIAIQSGINYQWKSDSMCKNEAHAIDMIGEGTNIAAVSIPCRYIHSSVSVCSLNDYNNTIDLLINYLKSFK
ncbi:M42 family peptidase [Clostridium sp. JN-1]|uniref:M42 family metallopeptidase n=1 Tax=Clostridium sp. JN-1 TaxID=2483110 RepID=UPI000F0AF673|nr:M42 family peptidase [Clostridium sp. JN-1]